MKKLKKSLLVILCLILLPLHVGALESYKELDPNNNINFPLMVWNNNNNKFRIEKIENYNLYYQFQYVDKETATEIKKTTEEIKSLSKDEINNKYDSCNILMDKYNTDKTEENLNQYNTCKDEYKTMVEEYNNKLEELQNYLFSLYKTYEDSKWIETKDLTFNGKIDNLTEDTMAILWAKLVDNDSNETIYDAVTVTLQGNKITTDGTSNEEKTNKVSYEEPNPNTQDKNLLLSVTIGILSIIILFICSKRIRKVR